MISLDEAKTKGFGGHGGLKQTVKIDSLQPLGKRVLVTDMAFGETVTRGGLILIDDNGTERGIKPRWCKVFAVGPKQKDIQVGDWILVNHGRWSRAIKLEQNGETLETRLVDHEEILGSQKDKPEQD